MASNLSNTAYDSLYNKILLGELKLGSPISEVALGKELGLSRSPIREALNRLEIEGLVTHYPGRGSFVVDFSLQDLDEIFDLRDLLEIYSLRKAFEHMDRDLFEGIEKEILAVVESGDPQAFFEINSTLHRAIISFSGNKRVQRFYDQISAQIAVINRISAMDPSHFDQSTERHLALIRAMKAGDQREAEAVLCQHLSEVRASTKKSYLIKKRV